eukprot:TRINITY_DN9077_c0_g1_i1.p1 TRINITY_DN9077_c0_g1~~TRINITY_DN9077_c0_g1_i1.p1  ORF type:complete len:102 (-),score=7.06 TRINITY_DN9077_c0_g1_i1:8-313(-)
MNMYQHGMVALFCWIEAISFPHVNTNKYIEYGSVILFNITYIFWNIVCFYMNGVFPYPFQNIISNFELFAFYLFALSLSLLTLWSKRILFHLKFSKQIKID